MRRQCYEYGTRFTQRDQQRPRQDHSISRVKSVSAHAELSDRLMNEGPTGAAGDQAVNPHEKGRDEQRKKLASATSDVWKNLVPATYVVVGNLVSATSVVWQKPVIFSLLSSAYMDREVNRKCLNVLLLGPCWTRRLTEKVLMFVLLGL